MSKSWRALTLTLLLSVAVGLVLGPPPAAGAVAPRECQPPGSDQPAVPWQTQLVGNVAHRGQSLTAPENTLEAARQAVAQGANFLGIDVRRTRDHRLVLLHNHTLAATTNIEQVYPRRRRWPVERFTLRQIRRLDAGSWFSPEYTGEKVPTLAQVLRAVRPSDTGMFLEFKQPYEYGGVSGVGRLVVRTLAQHTNWLEPRGDRQRLVIQAFNDTFVKDFAATYPDIAVSTLGPARKMLRYADAGADQVNVSHQAVTPELVQRAHDLCLGVATFIVNDAAAMRRVVSAGVDAISTDRPPLLARVLHSWQPTSRAMPTPPAPPAPKATRMSVRTPARARLGSRAHVRVRLRGTDGSPARFTWVRVQLRGDGRWVTLQRRATNRFGNISTSVTARRRSRLRVVSEGNEFYRAAPWVRRTIEVRR